MVENKSYVDRGQVPNDGTICHVFGSFRKVADSREVVKYSYRLVYTQESVRVLDMRFDFLELCNPRRSRELLEHFLREEIDRLK